MLNTKLVSIAVVFLAFALPSAMAQPPVTITPDPTFGNGGYVADHLDPAGQTSDLLRFLAVDRQGRPVAAGNTSGHRFAVVRYTRAGAPDATFAAKGKTAVCIEDEASIAASPVKEIQFTHGMTIDSKGRIVVVGKGSGAGTERIWDFALLRFTEDGALDKSFAQVGYRKFQAHEARNIGLAVAVAPDCSSLVAAGYATTDARTEPVLARFRESGEADEAFTTAASGSLRFLVKEESPAIATGVAIDKAGRYLVGMNIQKGDRSTWSLARLMPDGTIDATFATEGLWSKMLDPIAINEATSSTVIDPAGRIVLGGYSEDSAGLRRLAVARIDERGRLDSSFGPNSKGFVVLDGYGANVTYRYGPRANVSAKHIALTGAITGPTGKSTSFGLAVLDENGQNIAKIAPRSILTSRGDQPWAVAFDADERILIGGGSQGPNGKWRFAVARYIVKGSQ